MKKNATPLVSIVIPTYNSAGVLPDCLEALHTQSYKNIEILVVDGFSQDSTREVAQGLGAKVFIYGPSQSKGRIFGAPYQRNFGVSKAKGGFVYYMDADMVPTGTVIEACVKKAEEGFDAVIIREDSFGLGFWAACKKLERRGYWGDDNVEAPRFFRRDVWNKLGGLNDSLGADDWDMYDRLRNKGYTTARIKEIVLHNEGLLSLGKLVRKRYLYGRSIKAYVSTQVASSTRHFFPIRVGFIKNWRIYVEDPVHTTGVVVMRTLEYLAGFAGLITGIVFPPKVKLSSGKK